MSTRSRRARGRPPRTPLSINRTNFLRKPKAYQNLEQSLNRNGSPSPVIHLKSGRSERIRGRASAIRGRHFVSQFAGEDDEVSSLPEFEDRSSDITDLDNTDAYDNDDASDVSYAEESDVESSDSESLSTISSSVSRRRLLVKRPKTPEIPDDKEIPPLNLPPSATDLLLPSEHVLQALGVYEVLRHFRTILRLSPYTFEDFCACLLSEEQSNLLAEIHLTLLKALFREEESSNTTFGPQDLKDSINISLFFMDSMTWPEIARSYLDSEKYPEYRAHLSILESPDFPFVPYAERLKVLQTLTDLFLASAKVREEIMNEGNIQYDDHCRACHKLGDLLCCETCSAVYHLGCVEPPMQEVPEEDWLCSVCRAHQVKGVTDCISEAEKSGLLCRQEALGYDRHTRKYWFICRRVIVEGDNEVRYYSTKYQLEELLESLDVTWEPDLISFINEMKEDIIKQMSITEELTAAVKGSRKSILEIENAQLVKIQAERAQKREEEERRKAKEEEERKRKQEEERKKKKKEDDTSDGGDDTKDEGGNKSAFVEESSEVVESQAVVTSQMEQVTNTMSKSSRGGVTTTELVEVTSTTTTVTSVKSLTTTTTTSTEINVENNDEDDEPPSKHSKFDETLGSVLNESENKLPGNVTFKGSDRSKMDNKIILSSKSALAEAIKSTPDGKQKVISLHSLLPSARQALLNAVDKNGDDGKSEGPTKTVLLVNRGGGKVTLQVSCQPANKEESNGSSSVTQSTTSTTLSASALESRKMLTRSKTGSLTPKLFTDSITMTTTSLKTSGKSSEEILVLNKDGEISRVNRGKISLASSLGQQSFYFKLGSEGSYKQYQNQYTTNTLALNKHQHNEERDKKRHLSHKFSLTQFSEFKWNGNVMGNKMSTLATLRLTITQLEGSIQAPFLHSNWPNQRQNWQKAVQMCQSPHDFALALIILEACIKPCVMNPVWHESLGHLRLSRITAADREEWKKKEKEQRRRKEDEDEVRPIVWIKYTMGLKHQVWKQKGEEYRVTGGNGWQWLSSTRSFNRVPQDSVGLRLVARRLRNRRVKAAKSGGQRSEEDGDDSQTDEKLDLSVGEVSRADDDSVSEQDKKFAVKEENMEVVEEEAPENVSLSNATKKDLDTLDKNKCYEDDINRDGKSKDSGEIEIKQEEDLKPSQTDTKDEVLISQKSRPTYESYVNFVRQKYIENKESAIALELLKKHPEKADVELINVSEAMQKRTYYQKITKPYSKLDNLLERRLKQDEFERKQRLTIEAQIALKEKLNQAIEIAQRRRMGLETEENAGKEITVASGEFSDARSPETGPPYSCYSLLCRGGESGKTKVCYSPSCRLQHQEKVTEQKTKSRASFFSEKVTSTKECDSASSSAESCKESSPDEDTMDSQISKESNESQDEDNETNGSEKKLDENDDDQAIDSAVESLPANMSTEDEEVDIEGDTTKDGGSAAMSEGSLLHSSNGKEDSDAEKIAVCEKTTTTSTPTSNGNLVGPGTAATSVSDIVKNLVIKTMAEKAVASSGGKGSLLSAQALATSVANISIEDLRAKLPQKHSTADKFKLARFTRIGMKKRLSKSGRLPRCHKFETPSKKKSVFILERSELRKMARLGAKKESIAFNYNCKMNNVCWPYPCPRPLFKTAWQYRTITLQSLSAAALQLRVLWSCIRWDDMAAKPPAGGTNTVSTETEITTTELLKRREVGLDGLRSEFLVRKIVVPLGVPDKPKEKYTPQRSGLRERKRVEAVRQTEPSVTEVWVPEEVLELWEIKQFGEKLEKQRQVLQEKAEKAATGQSSIVTSQQTTAQIKAHMEQQLKQQRLALAQKRIQENQGIKVTTGSNSASVSTLASSSATTIIINNTSQLGKPGTTFKTLTVSSPGSLLSPGVIKTLQPRTIITSSGSLLGTQLRPGIRLQVPGSSIQLRPQTVTLAPKPGTTIATTSGVSTITRLISPATTTVARVLSPATPEATKTQTVQIRPQTPGQPVQNLHFTQTPGGQLQVRGLLPGQIIQRMPDGKLQIITLSTSSASATTAVAPTSTSATTQQQQPQQITPRSAVSIRPQAVMVSPAAGTTPTAPPPVVQNRVVIPAQLAPTLSIGQGSTPTTLTLSAVRPVLAGPVTSTPSKPIIVTRPVGPQIISAQNIASVLGSQNNQLLSNSNSSTLLSPSPAASSMSSAVVISAPAVASSTATPATQAVINTATVPAVLSGSVGGVTSVLVNSSQPSTLLSSVTSQAGQQTIISTLKPSILNPAAATPTVQTGMSLLGGQVISGTSLLQRSTGGTSLQSLSQLPGATLTISGPSAASQVPKQLASPPTGTHIITSAHPQLVLRPAASVLTGLGQTKLITAQQLKGLTTSPVQLKPTPVSLSPVRTVLSPQSSTVVVSAASGPKTVTAVRSLTPQLTLQTNAGQQQVATTVAATSLLSQGISLTSSPETGSAAASLTSPTPGTSPGAGSPKYAITPQVVEQVVRQALLQNQAPEIQQKLLAMQKQIQQQQQQSQPLPALTLATVTTPGSSAATRRGSQSGITLAAGKTAGVPASDSASRAVAKGLTQEQKEEQSRSSVCGQVMKNILDRIEREEKQEQRNKKKQESAEEKHKRMAAINQQKALYKHKEALKKEILRKRSLMEKNLQQEIYTEMADRLKKSKAVTSVTSPQPAAGVTAVSTTAASSVSQVTQGTGVRPKKLLVETPKPQPSVMDPKSSARKRKQKIISTGAKGLNPREKLYCVCKTPYDDSKFYIGCDLCSNWFHGACVNISEDRARYIDSYICEDCRRQRENTSEELYCLCRTPYDENQFYIGCDRCQDWFHGYCVGISKQEADSIEVYVCPNCQKEEIVDPIAQKPLTTAEYQHLQKLLKDLQVHKMAWPFLQPVDPKQVPDYYDVVSEPMDLTIVEAKLNTRAYHKLNDFVKDVTKIFDNCRLYNPVDTAYFQCAEVVETYFAQRIKALRSANKL